MPPRRHPALPTTSRRMVRDIGALRRAAARTSGAGVGGAENAPLGVPADPGAASRPPLRAIQQSASGAARWSLPTPRKGFRLRAGKAPAGVGAVSTSFAPRKVGPKLASSRSGFTTVGTSSVEEPRNKVRDAISFWGENSRNVQNVLSTLRQYDSHAPAKVEDCSDKDFVKNSEDVLKLHLELDIFKAILVEEKAAHSEVEQRTTALGDELKAFKYAIEVLESDLVISINESGALKKSKEKTLEILQKRDMEISRLNSELEILRGQESLGNEEPKIQTLKFYNAEDSPLSARFKSMKASLEKARNLNARHEHDMASHSSAEQEKGQICRQVIISESITKDKADELTKVKESIISLEQEHCSKSLELDDIVSDKQQLEAQMVKSNERVAALEEVLAQKFDELNIISIENAKLKSQLKQIERISCIVEELAHKSKITVKLEEDLIKPRSLQANLSKLSDQKQCCEAQLLIFKEKLEMAQALTAESESIATKAQQIAEERKAYAEERNKEVKLLERSVEDLEITVCELENKVNIIKLEAKHERMKREELELKLQNIRQQKFVVSSFGNAGSPLEDEMINLVDSTRHSQDIQNELLGAQEVSENAPEATNRTKPNPYPTVGATEPPTVGAEPAPQTEDPDEPIEESSLDEGLQELKETCVEMEEGHSSDEDYRLEVSEFEQPSPNDHLQQYSVSEQPELHRVGVDSDQSQSESRSEEQLPPPVVEIVEENELPPVFQVRHNDPVNYMRAPSDELKRLRSRNHYEGQRTATDRRFWSIEQQDLYTSIYRRAKLADMKWIDWKHIDRIEKFADVRKRCAHLGLEQIMSYCCHWDSELIRQFYSTVHISADKTSLTWMTDGRMITTNKRAWEERFSIPSGAHSKIHSHLFLNDDDKRTLYTAAEYTLGHISGLSPLASIANKILRTTIYPRFGNTTSTHSWNVLYHIVKQYHFDIISLIFFEIDLLISDHNRTKDPLLYAPYIMGMIMRAFEYEGPRESRHHSYKPRPCKQKLPKTAHTSAAGATPSAVSPLEPTCSAVQPGVAAAGHEAHVEKVDDHHQSEAAGHQPQVEAIQRRAELVQPITLADLFLVVENGLRPIRDKLASMESRNGRVEEGASVPAQHIVSSSSSQIPAPTSSLAPSLKTTSPAPPRAPATSRFSEHASVVHADNPGVSAQPVHVRPSPFSGFRWYQKK